MINQREEFEEAAARMGYNLTMAEHETGEYHYPVTQDAWDMWQECCYKARESEGGEPNDCPRCGSEFTDCDSSREMQVSEISCTDCGFTLQAEVDEDTLTEMWNLIRTEFCADYEECADVRAELKEMSEPSPPTDGDHHDL